MSGFWRRLTAKRFMVLRLKPERPRFYRSTSFPKMHKAKADSSDFFLNETFVLLSDVSLLLVWVVVI